ncbi:MAG TPA: hypothetical protein VH325_13995 [Bryobacteraceae bacterium]|jgi:hypothetical protein|nr:hypothetical protein [Bryobacteraceae bacterium]
MPSSEQDKEVKAANELVIESLRAGFGPLTTRLNWEIEPAPVYSPHVRTVDGSIAEAAE